MGLTQHKFREIVFQLLYSQDISRPDDTIMTELMMNQLAVTKKNVRLAQERMRLIQSHLAEIDALIASVSHSYEFERIQSVTKNILRLGVFELLFDKQIPPKVAIAEAIRLSRKFNTPESASFVNALLDHLYQKSQGNIEISDELTKQSEEMIESENKASEVAKEHHRPQNKLKEDLGDA